jgi:NAD(P)-dependent dehydrogenase (short-subunit alcohol dehydrogenase family)
MSKHSYRWKTRRIKVAKWTVADIPSQKGKLAVVTGANSGIGWHTALELARAGSEVILAARTEEKGRDAVERIRRLLPQAKVRFEVLDLASLRSVRTFAAMVGSEAKLNLLVNNAGVMAVPKRQVTEDGFELQFGTNFVGPFALTGLLMPALQRAASPRVTTVSSGAANMGLRRINFDDLQWERSYGPWKAYCQSKLADLMLMSELGRRSAASGVRLLSNAAHPGYARTNLQTSGPGVSRNPIRNMIEKTMEFVMSQDAARGALPTLRAATEIDAAPGSYYAPDRIFELKGDPVLVPVPKPARDEAAARRLWEVSERLTGVQWLAAEQSGAAFLKR